MGTTAAQAQSQVGVVRTVEGQVSVFSAKPECAPRYGLDLDEGDVVRTGEKSWALLTMMDGAKITLRPDSELRIDNYRYTDAGEVSQNGALLALQRGSVRVATGRIAGVRNSGIMIRTPDAIIDLRGADQDIAYLDPKVTPAGLAAGSYGKSYAGEAVLKNALGEVMLRTGQVAYAEPRAPPRTLAVDPYFLYWHNFIDRQAARVAEQLDAAPVTGPAP